MSLWTLPLNSVVGNSTNVTIPDYYNYDYNKEFPGDFMNQEFRNKGGFIIHIILLFYSCLTLALICDSYFVPVLQFISHKLKLPADISGATFMAVGTSAPELFASLIGVFIIESDIGTGTILGSAIFNLVGVPAVCGIAIYFWQKESISLNSFSIARDLTFYTITVIFLVLSMKDEQVDLIEASAMVALFGVYLFIMYINAKVVKQVKMLVELNYEPVEKDKIKSSSKIVTDESMPLLHKDHHRIILDGGDIDIEIEDVGVNIEEEDNWILSNRYLFYIISPMYFLFKYTLPNPKGFFFPITFAICSLYIGIFTYICIWMVTMIGVTFRIPETVAGITILAMGTSVPELIANVIVVKKSGSASMALSNTIGSNIFDILIGLGLPWLLKIIVSMANSAKYQSVLINSSALPFTAMTLLVTIFFLFLTLKHCNWKLGLVSGLICLFIYVFFVIFTTFLEYLV